MEQLSDEEAKPWLRKLDAKARISFGILQPSDREDLVQEAVRIALTREIMDMPLTWAQAGFLLIDAYRKINRTGMTHRMIELPTEDMTLIADAPNQIADLELLESLLTPEEMGFAAMLEDERGKGLNLAREAESRYLTGSCPLIPTDLWDLLA